MRRREFIHCSAARRRGPLRRVRNKRTKYDALACSPFCRERFGGAINWPRFTISSTNWDGPTAATCRSTIAGRPVTQSGCRRWQRSLLL